MERPSKSCARVSTSTVCLQRVTQRLPGVVGAVKYCYHPSHGPVSGRLWEWSRYPSPTHNFNLRPCECSYCQIGERVFVTAWSWQTTLQLPCWNFVWEWFETGNQKRKTHSVACSLCQGPGNCPALFTDLGKPRNQQLILYSWTMLTRALLGIHKANLDCAVWRINAKLLSM